MAEIADIALIVFYVLVTALVVARVVMFVTRITGHVKEARRMAETFNSATEYLRH
ncbi:MAG: hypothetical protein IIA72_10605 [Proteobacteria bacterium]|nr:hypothetical protein [Pseudomonadota bacterium]